MRDALRRLVTWLTGSGSGKPDESDPSDDSAFAGSLLDSSVNYSHGQSDTQAASEMAEIQAEAERLAEQDQHRER
ncbi:hypothetical protein SAMN05443574_101349 [Haloarcula vallismortis]|uniref:Uncharacterized protein n=2 Tax=Haloarcula vallismortis TaxID=28442 RepID=M0IW12_HALVA|nr:hypothetical protein [Haloarcula vallismortis]EMA00921.1 hypothetical protein C437_19022 [Haloarcula vallismortis ATCC 29715]SDW09768.1 hypothetical protein SAMN05443574_101349 [Haloarcula vallismortis]